jgi:hypothetical protein
LASAHNLEKEMDYPNWRGKSYRAEPGVPTVTLNLRKGGMREEHDRRISKRSMNQQGKQEGFNSKKKTRSGSHSSQR